MSIFRYYISDNVLRNLSVNTGDKFANNLINTAYQAAQTTAVAVAKNAWYSVGLSASELATDNESLLSTSGAKSPYMSGGNDAVRNNIIFKSNDDSLMIQLVDVKINTTQSNTIVRTPLAGRRGTVKEYIQATDFAFDVSGSIISPVANAFPLDYLKSFIKLFSTERNINVENVLMNSFGVQKVVMDRYTIDQQSTKYVNTINFKLSLISDDDIELNVTEGLAEYYNSITIVIPGVGTKIDMP
ncbi:MAG: DUF6046 domain-containing protein [Oscillospiraceae bacterium]|nr:DUF6046 domain-containing protein [Oscillospiraceae bacterium]